MPLQNGVKNSTHILFLGKMKVDDENKFTASLMKSKSKNRYRLSLNRVLRGVEGSLGLTSYQKQL